MASIPLLTTFLSEIRTAIAGMSAPDYNHTLSSGNVGDDPDAVTILPSVKVYAAGDIPEGAVTFRDREVTVRIYLDVSIQDQGSHGANRDATLLLLHDLSQLLHISRRSTLFASPGKVVRMDQTLNYHGDAQIGATGLPFGRMTLNFVYQRDSAGGF